ncbi:MAG: DoxX family protein [Elusimicrobiales bacterium]|nr:DoxX family protein [Elusimicrobiales bacterium]
MNQKPGTRELLGLLARLIVGGVFIYAGLLKALAPAEEFAYAIESYRVLDSQLSLYSAYFAPWLELWAGLLLACGVFTRLNALFTGAMLVFFELLLGQAWLRGLPITSCGCFGSGGSNSIGREFAQNLLFLALAWLAWKYGRAWSADEWVEKP